MQTQQFIDELVLTPAGFEQHRNLGLLYLLKVKLPDGVTLDEVQSDRVMKDAVV